MGLNPVGSFAFQRVDGSRTVEAIAAEVSARFGVTAERALVDVGAFLADLVARGLVEETRP